jgi:glycosyltransferase involved in cell wall biosynthesis
MRIAIDARELTGQRTGVGRYLWQLLLAWNDMPVAATHEFVLCSPVPHQVHALSNLRIAHRTQPRLRGTLWEQFSLPALASGADVLFAPGYTAPLIGRVPAVITIHDVSFAAHPEWFTWREGLRRRLLTRAAARRAARILTVSDFSKREIVRTLDVYPDKIEVIYSGIHQIIPSTVPSDPQTPTPDSQPLVLFVGSIFNRRHVPELIRGFALLAERHPRARLTLVGDNRTQPRVDLRELVARSGMADHIVIREYVTDEQLAALYGDAAALAFLSDYEGFGFTPLEGLAVGVPPVVLDTPVAREIYGPSAVYVPRPEPALIASALERVLTDEAERRRILDTAPQLLSRYSWRECAHRTLQVLLACAS